MRYLCVHCDKTFQHEDDAKKPRCPTCMRVNGIEPVSSSSSSSGSRPAWLVWALAGGVLALAGMGYAWWASQATDTVQGEAPLSPLDRSAVLGYLRNEGVDARDLATMLVPSEKVEAWARDVAAGADGSEGKARALLNAIRERAERGAFERWSFGVPRETPLAPPERVLEWLAEDGARHHLYPLELAALMTAGLRALDVDAMVAEAIRFAGERTPPDPSGQLGYFVVAVGFRGGEGEPTYFDPYAGRSNPPEDSRVLTDLQAIAAGLGTRALHLLSRESEPERAIEHASQALRLDRRSPALRAVRGAILIATGQLEQGVQELEAAKQLRTDAPRRNLLASVYLAPSPYQDYDAASREISAALGEYPEFAPGRTTLAALHLARRESDLARSELAEAERIDPNFHLLPQLWASYHLMNGETDKAIEHARASIARNPADVQAHLLAARIYRHAGRYDLMRREAHEVMDLTSPSRRAEMRQVIEQMLGPTALEPIEDDLEPLLADGSEEEEDALGDVESGSMRLDSPLLGGSGESRPSLFGGSSGGPSLLGGEQLGGGGLQLGGGGGGGLRLNFGGGE